MVTILVSTISAFIAVYFFAILLDAPKRSLIQAAATGAIGWMAHLILLERMEKTVATFVAGILIAILSQYFARRLKTPATVYFLPGFIPIVPGELVYEAVFAFIEGQYGYATALLNEALVVAGAIAMAIFVVDSLMSLQLRLKAISRLKNQDKKVE